MQHRQPSCLIVALVIAMSGCGNDAPSANGSGVGGGGSPIAAGGGKQDGDGRDDAGRGGHGGTIAAAIGGSSGTSAAGGDGGSSEAGSAPVSCDADARTLAPWPGQDTVKTLDAPAQFQSDVSGITYDSEASVLWAVNNLSSRLFRLVSDGAGLVVDTREGWASGKGLRYPDGASAPDAEGVTLGKDASDGLYVCSEHDTAKPSTTRLSVLRYDVSQAGESLAATHEWDVTPLLPPTGANTGLEAISWLPDEYLLARGFFDEAKQRSYVPADYPAHGAGLFVVGVEETGALYVLALNHETEDATLVASVATPNPGVMGLEFDRDSKQLWFSCDDTCDNESGVLDIDTRAGSATRGRFVALRRFARPTSLPNSNNEGIALGPAACEQGYRPFFWTDDADADGHSLRVDSIPCRACF